MELSLAAAAAEHPRRTALVTADGAFMYGELWRRVRGLLPELERRVHRVGTPWSTLLGETDLPTLLELYGLLELRRPVLLVDPRASPRERQRLLALPPEPLADGTAAIVPTSGTGGPPKAAVLSRRAFAAAARASAENLGWQDGDRWLLSLPVAHIGGLSILTRCLAARRTVVVHRFARFTAGEALEVIDRHRITLLSLVPTMLRRLAQRPAPASLRAVLVGGAAAQPELLDAARRQGWPVLRTYGLTEACSQVATEPKGVLSGMEARIADSMIELRGPQLFDGYLGLPSPFTADGWFRTGDLGRLDANGRLQVLGRRDEVIVSGGENIALGEVERALEAHPAVAEACAFGVEDGEWGQALAAALVAARDVPDDAQLVRHLEPLLARFQLPRRIAWLEALEHRPSGKLDRRRTAERARSKLRPLVR